MTSRNTPNQTFTSPSARTSGARTRKPRFPPRSDGITPTGHEELIEELIEHEKAGTQYPRLMTRVRQSLARGCELSEEQAYRIEVMLAYGCTVSRVAKTLDLTGPAVRSFVALTGREWPTKPERRAIHQAMQNVARRRRYAYLRDGTEQTRMSGELTRTARRYARVAARRGDPAGQKRDLEDRILRMTLMVDRLNAAEAARRNQRATTKPSTSEYTTSSGDLIRTYTEGELNE